MQASRHSSSGTDDTEDSSPASGSERRCVYIVDDQKADRDAAAAVCAAADYQAVVFSSGDDFLNAAGELAGGCVVLDVKMPGLDGLQVLGALSSLRPDMPVVMMSGESDIPIAVEAMKLGALDFVVKPCERVEFRRAVENAFQAASDLEVQTARAREIEETLSRISPRELEVLKLLLQGCRNKTVAFELGISERTVEEHRSRMMRRLGLSSFAELIRLAVQMGLANDAPPQKSHNS